MGVEGESKNQDLWINKIRRRAFSLHIHISLLLGVS